VPPPRRCVAVGDSLERIVGKITEADPPVAEIAAAAKGQAQGITRVGVAMTQMEKVTQGNAAIAEQTSNAADGHFQNFWPADSSLSNPPEN
jgi:methyl-accepting chemotaxis protein